MGVRGRGEKEKVGVRGEGDRERSSFGTTDTSFPSTHILLSELVYVSTTY